MRVIGGISVTQASIPTGIVVQSERRVRVTDVFTKEAQSHTKVIDGESMWSTARNIALGDVVIVWLVWIPLLGPLP